MCGLLLERVQRLPSLATWGGYDKTLECTVHCGPPQDMAVFKVAEVDNAALQCTSLWACDGNSLRVTVNTKCLQNDVVICTRLVLF